MAQEFIIKSQAIEDKINQLLPSQGGFQAGVDLSASTQVIPIVDLTETAEGSSVRPDLQTALSLNNTTVIDLKNVTDVPVISTTGYWKVDAIYNGYASGLASLFLDDGTTTKNVAKISSGGNGNGYAAINLILYIAAGVELRGTASANIQLTGVARQIADLAGNLVQPT